MARWYVGITGRERVAFRSEQEPTTATHSHLYGAVIGPFRTKRAAIWLQNQNGNNPHVQSVADAERLSKHSKSELSGGYES